MYGILNLYTWELNKRAMAYFLLSLTRIAFFFKTLPCQPQCLEVSGVGTGGVDSDRQLFVWTDPDQLRTLWTGPDRLLALWTGVDRLRTLLTGPNRLRNNGPVPADKRRGDHANCAGCAGFFYGLKG
jgi:hypothetical protein